MMSVQASMHYIRPTAEIDDLDDFPPITLESLVGKIIVRPLEDVAVNSNANRLRIVG